MPQKVFEIISLHEKPIWLSLRKEAQDAVLSEPGLASLLHSTILSHDNMACALSYHMALNLGDEGLSGMKIREIIQSYYNQYPELVLAAEADIQAIFERDPAAKGYLQAFMFFKGFLSLQIYRIAHGLWKDNRITLAHFLQSKVSALFQIDIHPAARIGKGIFMDHGTGIVIGETCVVEDDVSMLHGVTLGGTGA
jgi:serine O-acetyltransferase